mmetsp:Transcript_10663/g.19913  ORF Transcript_10663/g.19913 Transcript_10663/m.19913 type:complete len:938 (-) Transcript_10663:1091-3904(-)
MLLSDLLEPPLPTLPCYPSDFQNGVPLALVQVSPVVVSSFDSNTQNCLSFQSVTSLHNNLSSPIVKIFLQDICKNQSKDFRISWNVIESAAASKTTSRIRYLSGYLSKRKVDYHDHLKQFLRPIIMLPSSDPTNYDGIPCIVRVFSMAHVHQESKEQRGQKEVHVDSFRITNGTLVQILTSFICDWISDDSEICRMIISPTAFTPLKDEIPNCDEIFHRHVSLIHEFTGVMSVHQNYDDKDILLGYEQETIRALTIRMKILVQRQIMVGTTADATRQWYEKMSRRRRMSAALDRIYRDRGLSDGSACKGNQPQQRRQYDESSLVDSFPLDGALTVHDPIHGSGKTSLVATIATTELKCQAVHIVHASTLFAKYGASGADAALESLLHAVVVSAAVKGVCASSSTSASGGGDKEGSICIILDHLESFVPPSMMGSYNDGDPAIPALNSIRAYLGKLLSSIQNHNTFPFPTKNDLYNVRGRDGFVFPVRVCLIGIVTCDDDGGRKNANATFGYNSSMGTVLDVLGENRYRLPSPNIQGGYEIVMKLLQKYEITLCSNADKELPHLISSIRNPKAILFINVVDTLQKIIKSEQSDDKNNKVASLDQLKVAFNKNRYDGRPILKSERLASDGEVFSTVGGNEEAKKALTDALAFDERKVSILNRFGLTPPSGVLLYGPPGTGKTLLAKAIASMMQSQNARGQQSKSTKRHSGLFLSLRASDIVRSEVGKSEKLVSSAFQAARDNAPSVIFIDEFQALFTSRDGSTSGGSKGSGRLASTLLQSMDDVSKWRDADSAVARAGPVQNAPFDKNRRIVVFGATNTPWMIDKAFLRAGRFDRVVFVGLPDQTDRESILRVHVERMKLDENTAIEEVCQYVAAETSGFSGADLAALIRCAAVRCLNDVASDTEKGVELRHFRDARKFDMTQPTSNKELVSRLSRWRP